MSSKETKPKTATKTATQKQTTGSQEKVVAVPTANTIVEKKMEDKVVAVDKKATSAKKGGAKEAAPTPAPVQAAPVAEVKTEKKASGAKKGGAKEAAPVPAPVQAEPKVEAKIEKKAAGTKKGGAKAVEPVATAPVTPAPVKAVPVKAAPVKAEKKAAGAKKGGAKEEAVPAPVEAVPVQAAGGDDEEELAGTKLRYFKLIYNEEVQGRYCGKKPKQAANKAFSSIIKTLKQSGQQNGGVNVDINFTIRECTRNSKHKEYKYIGKRQVLDNPVQVKIANADGSVKQIEYKFHNKLQKAPKA